MAKGWHAAVGLVALMAGLAATPAAEAKLPRHQQTCITTFNKSLRDLTRAQARTVTRCLADYAAGRLVAATPEDCLRSDAGRRLGKTAGRAIGSAGERCQFGAPAFGISALPRGLEQGVHGQNDLAHAVFGADLDAALVPSGADATCQARVMQALLTCQDTRLREFLSCQKRGLRSGAITDAASLAAACLGSGDAGQPDPRGRIASHCTGRIAAAVARHCAGRDLQRAFAPCESGDGATVSACLNGAAACALCRTLNEADGLARDCDRFDDGDGDNGSCGAECGDGVVHPDEPCDDGNPAPLDGCSAQCTVEGGWTCGGEPSVCTPNCGNGALDGGETCDDGGTAAGDGCSAECRVEPGYQCSGQPSVCRPTCGNGALDAGEACDDGNGADGDGCSSACQVEEGSLCSGEPSDCEYVCGNGVFEAGEQCDDGAPGGGDGCSPGCRIEPGWLCVGQPSFCAPICGDGLRRGAESCDDGNATSGDGCTLSCTTELGYACAGQPSNCLPVCGDGVRRGGESCDDGNTLSGDGCSGALCRVEPGYACAGQPSLCQPLCGNGVLDGVEACDDGNTAAGDGCGPTCAAEPGYACGGQPSACVATCGNGVLDAGETCDDGNGQSGDGCSATCRTENGWRCGAAGLACARFEVFVTSPAHGSFTTAPAATISGHYTTLPPGEAAVLVDGVPAAAVNPLTRTFSHVVALDPAAVFNPVRVSVVNTVTGDAVHERIVVIAGPSVANGALSPQSVALRVNDRGLDAIEPLVAELAGDQLDLATILPPGTTLLDECIIHFIFCWGRAKVRIANPAPSFGALAIDLDAKPNAVAAGINVKDLRVDVDIAGSGLVPKCGLRLTANTLTLSGDYDLQPEPGQPSYVDVNLVTPMGVGFTDFAHHFTYGPCGSPLIQAFFPNVQQVAVDGIRGFLGDPDGSGPADSPIADAIESTLAGVSISGAVGSGLGLVVDAPLFDVAEDHAGVTLGAHSRFLVSPGDGPGQCQPPPGAPLLPASYSPAAAFPTFAATTPLQATPYGIGIGISAAGMNQLLRGQTECGLLRTSLDSIDIDGEGGAPPLPLSAGLLALLVPELALLPPATPLRIDVVPTLAPLVTGQPGPGGELAELRIAQVRLDIVDAGTGALVLRGVLDARLGMDLAFLPDGSGLAITLAEPRPEDLSIVITTNPFGADEADVEAVLPGIVRPMIPSLAGALAGFPLPQFFGLSLQGVEVSHSGEMMALFADLEPAP